MNTTNPANTPRSLTCFLVTAAVAWLSLATAAATRLGAAEPAPAASGPVAPRLNIVFILADDLGYGDLGCYGQKRIKTPHLDALAADGVKFTQMYAGSTVCTPSRCCLMTGLHTGHGSLRGNDELSLRPQDVTVAEVLKKAGYQTAMIGKWGIGQAGTDGEPRKKGFDYFYGYLHNLHAHNYYPTFLWRNETREPLRNVVPDGKPNGNGVSSNKAQYSNDLFEAEALRYLDQDADADKTADKGSDKDAARQPFFLYLPFTIPHANDEAGRKGMEVPDLGAYADTDWPEPQKGYAAMVTRLDGYVGRITARLKDLHLDENTIVFFASDNGPHHEGGFDPTFFGSAGPLRGIKRDLYEGGIREPFLVRWPGHTHAGTTCDFVGSFQDVLATAADLAGVPASAVPRTDGVSIVPAILGDAARQKQHEYLYWEFYEGTPAQAVRMGDWKAIRKPMQTGKVELFDLKADLGERHDVAAEHTDVVKKMEEAMAEAHVPSDRTKPPGVDGNPPRKAAKETTPKG